MKKFVKSAMVALIAGVFATSIYAAADDMDSSSAGMQDQMAMQQQQDPSAAQDQAQAQAMQGQVSASADQQANAQNASAQQDQQAAPAKRTRMAAGKSKCRYGSMKKCDKNGKNCRRTCKPKSKKMAANADATAQQDAAANS